jgi:transposase InsO family protein
MTHEPERGGEFPPLFYVVFVIDVFVRYIVGWKVSASAHTDFVPDSLEQALHDRQPKWDGELNCHGGRGQYVSIGLRGFRDRSVTKFLVRLTAGAAHTAK